MVLNIRHVVQPVQEPMDTSDDAGVFNVELQNSLSLIHKFLQAFFFFFFFVGRPWEQAYQPPCTAADQGWRSRFARAFVDRGRREKWYDDCKYSVI